LRNVFDEEDKYQFSLRLFVNVSDLKYIA